MKKRLKIIISAYACNPYEGSEKSVGWGWVSAIARYHDLWVLTEELNKPDIEQKVREDPASVKNINFIFLPRRRWFWLEKICPPAYLWTYRLWQRYAYEVATQLHKEIRFDLAHQLTYVGFRVPGYLWKIDIPFVWGPIGGLENTPWQFLPVLGLKGALYYAARNIINSLQKRFLMMPKRAFKRASGGIIAATEGIKREILEWYELESEIICEVGPPATIAGKHSSRISGEPLLITWSGLHLPGKALPLLLKALSRLSWEIRWQLDILGNGACTRKWQRQSIKLGIDSRCRWHGWLPRDKAMKVVKESHVFVITSLKDLTSTVLLEALSLGVPVICPDHCGFKNVVTEHCGIKVPVENPFQLVSDLACAIKFFAENEDKRCLLAKGALTRIRDFSWAKKADEVNSIYLKKFDNYYKFPAS
ncbi:MAG: glycosyltransferase family 4 protein [Nitrospirae bacterium]|nr:glycosyltransferase family 4 protein [Nitrospirota bacterium]